MAQWPERGDTPWGDKIKAYIDEADTDINDRLDVLLDEDGAIKDVIAGVFDIEKYGANPDGSGNNSAAIIAAMEAAEAAGGGTIWLPRPVDYLCEQTGEAGGLSWAIPVRQDNITFAGVPGSGLKTTQNTSLILLSGAAKTYGAQYWYNGWIHGGANNPVIPVRPIEVADKGDHAVTFTTPSDAAGYEPGDLIYIRTGHTLGADGSMGVQPMSETNEVVEVNSSTGVVMVRWPLSHTYAPQNYVSGHPLAGTQTPFGCANATGHFLRNVVFKGIRLISTYDDAPLMPMGQVIGLTVEDCYVESAGHFISLNDIRMGLYRDNEVHLTRKGGTDVYWWFTTATGTVDVVIENNNCTAKSVGNIHIHEGSANVTMKGGVYRAAPLDIPGGHSIIAVRAECDGVFITDLEVLGSTPNVASIYVDDTCKNGLVDGVRTDGAVAIAAPGFILGPRNTAPSFVIYNGTSGGNMVDGAMPSPIYQLSTWVTASHTEKVLGPMPASAFITKIRVFVTEAFNGSASNFIQVGKDDNPTIFHVHFPVQETGEKTGQGDVVYSGLNYAREIVTAKYEPYGGDPPTTGKALVVVEFVIAPFIF